jgi:hypothetical protein
MNQVLAAAKLKKIEKRKFSQTNPLPDFFHYEGESPKVKSHWGKGRVFTGASRTSMTLSLKKKTQNLQ